MNERVKELRKTLGLSGEKFGAKLGVTRTAISLIESGKNNLSEQMLLLICREFNVNEDWLRTGKGEMFVENADTFLEELSRQYNLDSFDKKILENYISLSPEKKTAIKDYLRSLSSEIE